MFFKVIHVEDLFQRGCSSKKVAFNGTLFCQLHLLWKGYMSNKDIIQKFNGKNPPSKSGPMKFVFLSPSQSEEVQVKE
jgi:hypothetical protein